MDYSVGGEGQTSAYIITADGTVTEAIPDNAKGRFSLEKMQKIVGGYIEALHTSDGRLMLVDEDAKIKQSPVNEKASILYKYGTVDQVRGTVLILAHRQKP